MDGEGVKIGMTPPHPGSFVRTEILEELGLSVTRAAGLLGVRRATLSDLLNEKAGLSPEMALRIEKAFGVSVDTLLRMAAWYEGHVMRRRSGDIGVKRYEPGHEAKKGAAMRPAPGREKPRD